MDSRKELLSKFIKANNIESTDMHLIASDASFRKYYRSNRNKTLIMDAPYEKGESVKSFKKIAKILIKMGISAPIIHSIDEDNGFLLLEDLGDEKFSIILNKKNEKELYQGAVSVLAHVYLKSNEREFDLEDISYYSLNHLIEEANIFCDWFLEKHCQLRIKSKDKLEYEEILKRIYNKIEFNFHSLVLRDYHVDNLILLKDRKGINQVGVIDFQDAVVGSNVYDLVSLLEDVRRPIGTELKNKLTEKYIDITKYDSEKLLKEMRFFSVQRNLKIIGIFSRLKYRDQKPQYMKLVNNAWSFIDRHLEDSSFIELKLWISEYKNEFL